MLVKTIKRSSPVLKKNSKGLALRIAQKVEDKKGEEIVVLDLQKISPITDYFVIATGLSDVHLKNLAKALMEEEEPHHVEGYEGAQWILLDYVDVVVHLFLKDVREFYGLERLWGDAPLIELADA